ncbi:MAG: hypothetical protein KDB01_27780, partial [Planctomycetaceae bacterium]|nr:hypothetical protein [Planctomycetaceae bacterium]
MLVCPGCKRLTHAAQLESLATKARSADAAGDLTAALEFWREALELLPRDSKQYALITSQISQLGQRLSQTHVPGLKNPDSGLLNRSQSGRAASNAGLATGLGAMALFAWRFKVLLAGLTKSSTLFSMLASLGVYWTVWGWKFALGLVLSIYVHEIGHIIELRRYGFRTGAPTFIP